MRGNPRPLHGYLVRRRLECIKKSRHPNLRSWSFRRVAEWRLLSWTQYVIKFRRWKLKSTRLLADCIVWSKLLDGGINLRHSLEASGLFTRDQFDFDKCQVPAQVPYMTEASWVMHVVVCSMRFKRVCLVQSDSFSLRLSAEYLTTTECEILEHASVQCMRGVQCMRLWSGVCFNFTNPKWAWKTLDMTIQSRIG